MPVFVPDIAEVSGLGAAMCAAAGAGACTLEEAMRIMKASGRLVEPDPAMAAEYLDYYQRWSSTSKWLEKMSEEM
jgi:sugar (pentulose or hexulose) kinase